MEILKLKTRTQWMCLIVDHIQPKRGLVTSNMLSETSKNEMTENTEKTVGDIEDTV